MIKRKNGTIIPQNFNNPILSMSYEDSGKFLHQTIRHMEKMKVFYPLVILRWLLHHPRWIPQNYYRE